MPRLRRVRDTNWEPDNEDFPEALASPEGDQSNDVPTDPSRPYEGVEGEGDTGASWLSNAVIIGSISDDKLKATLARYKSLVRLCETELAARAVSPRRSISDDRRLSFVERYAPSKSAPKPRRLPKKSVAAKRVATKPSLAPEQLLKALQMLIQLKREKDKGANDK